MVLNNLRFSLITGTLIALAYFLVLFGARELLTLNFGLAVLIASGVIFVLDMFLFIKIFSSVSTFITNFLTAIPFLNLFVLPIAAFIEFFIIGLGVLFVLSFALTFLDIGLVFSLANGLKITLLSFISGGILFFTNRSGIR